MTQCLIPNCKNDAEHNLGVRLRRPDTTAIWAPNCDAFLCKEHTKQGYIVDVKLTPAPSGNRNITTNLSVGGRVVTRTTPIIHQP